MFLTAPALLAARLGLALAALPTPAALDAPRQESFPVPPAAEEELSVEGDLTAGARILYGNSDQREFDLGGHARLERARERLSLAWFANVADQTGAAGERQTTDRRYGGSVQVGHFYDEDAFVALDSSAETSLAANLKFRGTLDLGVGRRFGGSELWVVEAQAGAGYFYEEPFESPDPETRQFATSRFAYHAKWSPFEQFSIEQRAAICPRLSDPREVYSRLDTRTRYELNDHLFGQVQWLVDWDNTPPESAPERTDHRVAFTIGWRL